ncbi:MAG TPA: sulfotransferase [Casimicrobiaceae bacterium]|nr:sulfotransferase [Casimicrobiaceae bacterium]
MSADAIDSLVVFTGRGGSGTRLLSQLAAELGIFIGNRMNPSGDSTEWVELIYRMAIEVEGAQRLPSDRRYRDALRAKAAEVLRTAPARSAATWGLKLPEAMLILPLLADAFPASKVVHLTRHPVSASLMKPHLTSRPDTALGMAMLPNAYRYSKRDASLLEADEPYVHNACSWNYQVRRVVDYGRGVLRDARYLEVRYEDLCADPASAASLAGSFVGCAGVASGASIEVDSTRIAPWDSDDPRIETIREICGETAGLLGYSLAGDASLRLTERASAQKRE